jgi:hypothetical protein
MISVGTIKFWIMAVIDCVRVSEHELENLLVISPSCFDELGTGVTKDVSLVGFATDFCSSAQ